MRGTCFSAVIFRAGCPSAETSAKMLPTIFDPDRRNKYFDWWSKYYCSIEEPKRSQKEYTELGYDHVVVYPGELEEAFNKFTDLFQRFPLSEPQNEGLKDPEKRLRQTVGYIMGSLKVYPLPVDGSPEPERMFCNIPFMDPVEVIVRVYIIRVSEQHAM